MFELLFGAAAFGDVAVDDDQLCDLSILVANGARDRFENAPASVLVFDAVVEALADSGLARLARCLENPHAIFGMDLLERRSFAEFSRRVSKNAFVGRTVI